MLHSYLRKFASYLLLTIITDHCPSWFSYVFTYSGSNQALTGFFNAIVLVMEEGFALAAFIALILNLILPEEMEDEEIPELTANTIDEPQDEEEWRRIRREDESEKISPAKA